MTGVGAVSAARRAHGGPLRGEIEARLGASLRPATAAPEPLTPVDRPTLTPFAPPRHRMRLRTALPVLPLLVLLVSAAPARAQAILNVERLQAGERSGFYGALRLSGSYAAGNTDVRQIDGALGAGLRGERHWPRLFAGGELLRGGSGRIVDNRFVHARYSVLFSPRARSFHFVQVQSNNNLLVEWRLLVGSGMRAAFPLPGGVTLELGTGPMLEEERLDAARVDPDDDVETSVWRLASLGVVRWEVRDDVTLLNVVYHQPAVDDFGDFRVLDDLTLSMEVASNVAVDVTLNWRHDSRPPGTLDQDDVRLRVGLTLDWGG